jgi:predicted dienelactone hydrolase
MAPLGAHFPEHFMKPDRALTAPRLTRRRLLALTGGVALGSLALGRVCAQDAAGGVVAGAEAPSAFRTVDLDWLDATRDRAVPVRLYLPDVSQPVPLVVFSHGIGGSRLGYSYLGKHLAANGIACLHLQHVGSDRNLWFGNPFTLVGRLQKAADEVEARARAADLHFALTTLLAQPELAQRIDASRIAAGGHSYGANTTMLAAGARVQRGGEVLQLAEPLLKGALLLSSPPFYGERDLSRILGPITLPTLHITTTEDVINVPGYHSPVEDRLAVYQAMGSRQKALAVFEGGSHSIFTDRTGPGGPELNARVKQATQDFALAFLQSLFNGSVQAPGVNFTAVRDKHASLIHRFDSVA